VSGLLSVPSRESAEKGSQIGWTLGCCRKHAVHVERFVRVRDDVPKACCTSQSIGERRIEDLRVGESAKGLTVAGGRPQPHLHTTRNR